MNIVDLIVAYEAGELNETQEVELFQQLVDTGLISSLQGSYGRQAYYFVQQGLVQIRSEVA